MSGFTDNTLLNAKVITYYIIIGQVRCKIPQSWSCYTVIGTRINKLQVINNMLCYVSG